MEATVKEYEAKLEKYKKGEKVEGSLTYKLSYYINKRAGWLIFHNG